MFPKINVWKQRRMLNILKMIGLDNAPYYFSLKKKKEKEMFVPLIAHGSPLSSSGRFSRSFVSSSLQPHGLQHAWLPCPSPVLHTHAIVTSLVSLMGLIRHVLCLRCRASESSSMCLCVGPCRLMGAHCRICGPGC